MDGTRVEGHVDLRFAAIADAFAANFEEGAELGAAVALYIGGRLVVDLWGCVADRRTGRPWTADTIVVVFSASKGIVGLCVADLVDSGRIELEAPVVRYWPEFGQAGKAGTTVRWLLSHRAGLPEIDRALTFEDVLAWTPVVQALEEQLPRWPPGIRHGYHALTFGWLAGELVRRVTGHTPGSYVRRRFAEPLGLDAWIGLPTAQSHRLARLEQAAAPQPVAQDLTGLMTLSGALPATAPDGSNAFNDPAVLTAEIPAANAVTTARDLAALYSAAVSGIPGRPPLHHATISDFITAQAVDPPAGGGRTWGTGFMLHSPPIRPMLGPRSFGHDGATGCVAFGDDEHGVGFAYVTNQLGNPDDERANRLTAAVRNSLGLPACEGAPT